MAEVNKDLQNLAKSSTEDFYELLGVPFDANEATIKKAYRKVSIRYHPDKNPDNKDAADRFIYLGWARDILIDETLKGEYDRARARRREKALKDDLLDSRRRAMKEDLERREHEAERARQNLKRKGGVEVYTEAERRELEKLGEAECERMAENNKRRRRELTERREKQRKEYEEASFVAAPPKPGQTSEISRSVKLVFTRSPTSPPTLAWDASTIETMFSKYGKVQHVIAGKDKKVRIPGEKHRIHVVSFFVVYTRLDHAYEAVLEAKTDFPGLDGVSWAAGEPDCLKAPRDMGGNKGFGGGATPLDTPSPEEVTIMRLKQAEKKRLEEQIRRPEAAKESSRAPAGVGSNDSGGTPLRPLGKPQYTFEGTMARVRQAALEQERAKRLKEQIRRQEAGA
ncbi:DnaJ DnaJ-class molecular chaperone with C-terminal Zn finger domain [Pyrenophora tritici-repentis]|nr:DnaJ DnaJ-class molecular chaperone with C-terminal Zn finger domain [Pyrenophora tritici-repentis]KAI1551715.1 DnaJ DnaJ-class molecular chaperone with C-terminal Zn finger domain [Pyrenophora tritici-repentis]KAI1585972.1 DnaJ DnaJ-class molecular chaperone with C-terminal Zn finger domain [Pyrenophora tritici-repentis]KAI1596218.1 DnaJ DnaJ-class molecular chaperone with C-terminal Zn finger domain [Pyrenophora tritici-repentis]KAI1606543.1 DnaJ DnaJ-class molecular chaperone with C-termi